MTSPQAVRAMNRGRRKNAPAKVGDTFGDRRVTKLLPRDRTSNERVEWRCVCGEWGQSYVFNLRKMATTCRHGRRRRELEAPLLVLCHCGHDHDDHRTRGGECLDDDCECIAFDLDRKGSAEASAAQRTSASAVTTAGSAAIQPPTHHGGGGIRRTKEASVDVEMIVQLRTVAEELRRIRQNPPDTVGSALPAYGAAIRNARKRGVEPALLLVLGEILWMSIRPEKEPAPDAIGLELEALWKTYLDDLAFCAPRRS